MTPMLILSVVLAAEPESAVVIEKKGLAESAVRPLKEPAYQTEQPLYGRLLLKGKPDVGIWMVMDGDHFYFDRNGNGDLTEPGEKLLHKPDPGHKLKFTNAELRERFGEVRLRWGTGQPGFLDVSLSYEGKFVLGSIQEGSDLSKTPEKAPVILISDELTLFVFDDYPKFQLWTGNNAGTKLAVPVFLGTKSSTNHYAGVEPESLPKGVHPVAEIQYSPKNPGDNPRLQLVDLDDRGMGYFSGSASVPQKTPPGPVTVTVNMKNWKFDEVQPAVVKTKLPEFKHLPVFSPE